MAINIDANKKILLDADVIIHFSKGEHLGLLKQIFPNDLYILDEVFQEVFKGTLKTEVQNLISYGFVKELETPKTMEFLSEMAEISKNKANIGEGELFCMAYCKLHDDVLASSNLRDIKDYCEQNDIQYLTTMNFLHEAYDKGLLTEVDCDLFIYNVKSKKSKLPFNTIKEYIDSLP